ncbi:MAG: copper amine oxidase N-terminal domain-containing protein [Firmicutes bacterium]|nr:copper amine oxidase N-terminal domain-containing protein [Bacillota bacterium]
MMRVKLLKAILLSVLCFITAAPVCYAASVFDRIEQVKDYPLNTIAATDNICIASARYYLTSFDGENWSDAIYIPETGYEITDLCSIGNSFYMSEYNSDAQIGKLLTSFDGEEWDITAEYETEETDKFMTAADGTILIICPADTILPEGFAPYAGAYESYMGNYSVSFSGKTILVNRKSNIWYSATDADGNIIDYELPEFRSDNAIEITSPTVFTVDGILYKGKNPCIESEYYIFENGRKYYSISIDRTGVMQSGSIFYFETDDSGEIIRDENGKINYTYISCQYPIVNYKYADGILYAEFLTQAGYDSSEKPSLEYGTTEWKRTSDLDSFEHWENCSEPLIYYNMAEIYDGRTKFRFENSNKVWDVIYENQTFSDTSNNTVGTLYRYYLDNTGFYMSSDGIYYTKFDLPDKFFVLSNTKITEDGDDFVIQSGIYQIRAPKNEIYSKVEEASEEPIYVALNDTLLAFETAPVIENDRTLIPIRFLFEQMGAEVSWDSDAQTAVISQNDTVITFTADNTEASVNGEGVSMDVPARIINGKTMVPLRFLSETLGYTVTWYDEIAMAEITY